MIGINIGSQYTDFSVLNVNLEKTIYTPLDFKLNPLLNDHLDRVLESIIQYKENNRLFASSTKLGYKKYCFSTFNNLSRLIGFIYKLKINEEEQKYFLDNNFDKEKGIFKFELNKIPYEIKGDDCVCSYLKKLDEKIKTKFKTDEKQTYIFSVPDYYTYYQKVALKIILQSLKLDNEYPFINESTALTMYYGYLNYKEFTNENKYVIFVDIGHSKTSFILSEFTKNEFIVKEVENIPFLGGRDFNDRIFEKCLNQFQIENNQNLEVNGRIKYKLYEEIEKARKNLTINDSTTINVDALDGENDFSYEITKEEFEKLINNEIEKFKNEFELFYNKVKKYPIWRIEMGGQLLRTPILEEIIYKISNIKLSKTIALDECHSLGTLLYTLFIIQGKKFEYLKNVLSYNMYNMFYYDYENKNKILFLKKGENFKNHRVKIEIGPIDYFNKEHIHFLIGYNDDTFKELFADFPILFIYSIEIKKLKEYRENHYLNYSYLYLIIIINEANELKFELRSDKYYFEQGFLIEKFVGDQPFNEEEIFNEIRKGLEKNEKIFNKLDLDFKEFSGKRTELENRLNKYKTKIKKENIKNPELSKKIRNIEQMIKSAKQVNDLNKIEAIINSLNLD